MAGRGLIKLRIFVDVINVWPLTSLQSLFEY